MKHLISLILIIMSLTFSAYADDIDHTVLNLKLLDKNNNFFLESTDGEITEVEIGRTLHRYKLGGFDNDIRLTAVYDVDRDVLSLRNTYNFNKTVLKDIRIKVGPTLSYVGPVDNYGDGNFYLSASIEATKPMSNRLYLYGKYGATWDMQSNLDKTSEYIVIGLPIAIERTMFITPNITAAKAYTQYGDFETKNFELDFTFLF